MLQYAQEENHINELNPAFEDLTRKGIPVIYKDKNGVVQTAEIERGEIIFSKEITDKIEKRLEKKT